jgi:two-component system, NarL family, sensor histidine kinase BarA
MTGLPASMLWRKALSLRPGAVLARLSQAAAPPAPAVDEIRRAGRILKSRVWFISAMFMLMVSVLSGALVIEQQRAALDRAKFEASNLSAAFQQEVDQFIDHTGASLRTVAADIPLKGPKQALSDWLQHRGPDARHTNMTMLDAEGKVVFSTVNPNWTRADLSDRLHFKVHAGNPAAGLYISPPVLTRGSKRVKIPLSIRLNQPDGSFAGTLFATVEPEFLTVLYHSVNLGQTGSLMLVGEDGAVRAYLSRRKEAGGGQATAREDGSADGTEAPALRAPINDTEGQYEGRAADGIDRLYHWRRIADDHLLVIVGLGKEEALSTSVWLRNIVAAACSLALLFAGAMPFLLSREISKRIAHEIELHQEKANLTLANSALDNERYALYELSIKLSEAKQQAEEASAAKSAFLAYMGHEFRTPMHAILAYTKMAIEDMPQSGMGKIPKYIENSQASGVRLLGLLNNLLDFAKLEAGKIELQTTKASLAEIAESCRVELNSLLEEKKLTASIIAKPAGTRATIDSGRMTQVFINLFSNAIKFSPPGGLIEVEIADSELPDGRPALQCSVSDQGAGIPELELATIFGRFNQSSATKKNRGSGTGLGLPICRELVALHGGQIWAANRPKGGAIITFAIPKDQPALAQAA